MNAKPHIDQQNTFLLDEPPTMVALPDGNEVSEPATLSPTPSHSVATAEPGPDDDDPPATFEIPRQYQIIIRGLASGGVLVEQEGEHGTAEMDGGIVEITAPNVVRFARAVLHAAGFRNVEIATMSGLGGSDIEDGDEAWMHERRGQ